MFYIILLSATLWLTLRYTGKLKSTDVRLVTLLIVEWVAFIFHIIETYL